MTSELARLSTSKNKTMSEESGLFELPRCEGVGEVCFAKVHNFLDIRADWGYFFFLIFDFLSFSFYMWSCMLGKILSIMFWGTSHSFAIVGHVAQVALPFWFLLFHIFTVAPWCTLTLLRFCRLYHLVVFIRTYFFLLQQRRKYLNLPQRSHDA